MKEWRFILGGTLLVLILMVMIALIAYTAIVGVK